MCKEIKPPKGFVKNGPGQGGPPDKPAEQEAIKLLLASQSPRRREYLSRLQIPFAVIDVEVDETIEQDIPPEQLVRILAGRKALAASQKAPGALCLGADTIVVLDGRIFGKPKDGAEAFAMLTALSGRVHQVYTGLCLAMDASLLQAEAEVTNVSVGPMSEAEIMGYIATGEPMDKAGANGIQGLFAPYVKRIEGCYYNVVGLPLAKLHGMLKALGMAPSFANGQG